MKKKILLWSILTAGLLFLAACEPKTVIEPTKVPEWEPPTLAEQPQETPEVSPTSEVLPTITEALVTPVETIQPTSIPTMSPTPEPVPTRMPELSPTPLPELPTSTPTPTAVPTEPPTNTPTPTATPTPTVTPTPTINPEPLVTRGWQKTVSMEEEYAIVFPEIFRNSTVLKTEKELLLEYMCEEDEDIKFSICYSMKQKLIEAVEEILLADGIIENMSEAELRVQYRLQKDGRIYCGILLENFYSKELLGNSFGDEEQITGVMEVVFSYPADRAEEYEAENYRFYVVKNREE